MTISATAQPASTDRRQTKSQPLVTVVVCVYNAGAFLRPAVESVVGQTYSNLEIIIVDDGSTDGCMETIADIDDPRIRRLSQPNSGKPAAMNRALDEMRGDFYVLNDADDISHPRRTERLVAGMLSEPRLGAIFSGFDLILDGRVVAPRFRERDEADCRKDIENLRMPSHDPTAMFRASAIRGLRYERSLRLGEGHDFILRVGEQHPLRVLGECLYSYRVHSNSLTERGEDDKLKFAREVARRAYERRGLSTELYESGGELPNDRLHTRSRRRTLIAHFMESVLDLRGAGRWSRAVGTAWRCLLLRPLEAAFYKPLAYAFAPRSVIAAYRARKG